MQRSQTKQNLLYTSESTYTTATFYPKHMLSCKNRHDVAPYQRQSIDTEYP